MSQGIEVTFQLFTSEPMVQTAFWIRRCRFNESIDEDFFPRNESGIAIYLILKFQNSFDLALNTILTFWTTICFEKLKFISQNQINKYEILLFVFFTQF